MKNEITAKRLQLALSNANMKSQELADRSGVNKASISQYVNGSHAPSNISSGKMAKVLGVSPLWLMGFEVPMIDTLTIDVNSPEASLISSYRRLDPHDRGAVDGYVAGLLEADKYKKAGLSEGRAIS